MNIDVFISVCVCVENLLRWILLLSPETGLELDRIGMSHELSLGFFSFRVACGRAKSSTKISGLQG